VAGEVQFPAPAVTGHAGSVDAIADSVVQARAAVTEVTMSTEAYGQLCQFLPGLLSPVFSQAVSALNDATDSLREIADNLRAVAASVTATDSAVARDVGSARLELPL
jgi:uncharacterized protein YukE